MGESKRAKRKPSGQQPVPPHSSCFLGTADAAEGVSEERRGGFAIVGLGVSAGGVQALTELFAALPERCGLGFVVVAHLSPEKSALTEVLGHASRMPVEEATQGVVVEADRVYVIPSSADLTIADGRLQLSPRPKSGRHLPIDAFLRSLATECRERSIGVILSGTGSDGTLGIQEIQGAGGLTFAQDDTAQHPGMPRSAIASGAVDAVLSPTEIARELVRLASAVPYGRQTPAEAGTVSETEAFREVVRLLKRATGIEFEHYKVPTLTRRIDRRRALRGSSDLRQYVGLLREDPAEVQALARDVLIQVTRFFRDGEMFETLRTRLLPRLIADRSADDPLRIWVPGCSTGEEVYSLAICVLEALSAASVDLPVKIFGSDVDEAAIAQARTGRYSDGIASDVSAERLQRFFVRTDGTYDVARDARDLCVFARHDMTRDPPFSRLDLICCRNVLIYFDATLQDRVLSVFHYALKPGGFLMLGHAESVGRATDLFRVEDAAGRVFVRGETGRRTFPDFAPSMPSSRSFRDADRGPTSAAESLQEIAQAADRAIHARFAPPGVIVDEDSRIVQFRGETGPYLAAPPGVPTVDLPSMCRRGLLPAVQSAVDQARTEGAPVRRAGVRVDSDGRRLDVDVVVLPLYVVPSDRRYFLVLFQEHAADSAATSSPPRPAPVGTPADGGDASESERLREELAAARAHLQATVEKQSALNEELRAANEEVLAANEELQSTNEELETAKEELQAGNEELTTINDELRSRIERETRLKDDMANLVDAVNVPTVVVGGDLRIRRWSPGARTLFGLQPGDAGRALTDLRPVIDVPDLAERLREVLSASTVRECEVLDGRQRWHRLSLRPYRTADDRVDGAVITLVDVDDARRSQLEAQAERDVAESIIETVHEPLLVLDRELRIVRANRSFHEAYGSTPAEVSGTPLTELSDGRWDIPALRTALRDVASRNAPLRDFELEHDLPGLGRRSLLVNAGHLRHGEGSSAELILLALHDVTARKAVADEQLRAGRDLLRTIVETATDAIVTIDESGCLETVNPAAERMFGYPAGEMCGRDVRTLVPSRRHGPPAVHLSDLLRTGETGSVGHEREFRGRRRDGSSFPIGLSVNEIPGGAGRQFAAIIRDLTERKSLERQILEIGDEEERRIGQDLHDGAGQELVAMSLLAQELADSLTSVRRKREADLARKMVDSVDRVQRQVREFARGLVPVEVEREGLMAALGELAAHVSESGRVRCRFECPDPVPIDDAFVATHLYRIAQEAVANAVRHGRAANVTVRLAGPVPVTLSIRDDGQGIGDVQEAGRSGLGLRTMAYRADLIGGALEVASTPGDGTLVTCAVPKETGNAALGGGK